MKDVNKKVLAAFVVVIVIILGVWWATIQDAQRLLNRGDDREVVYEGNTEDRPQK